MKTNMPMIQTPDGDMIFIPINYGTFVCAGCDEEFLTVDQVIQHRCMTAALRGCIWPPGANKECEARDCPRKERR